MNWGLDIGVLGSSGPSNSKENALFAAARNSQRDSEILALLPRKANSHRAYDKFRSRRSNYTIKENTNWPSYNARGLQSDFDAFLQRDQAHRITPRSKLGQPEDQENSLHKWPPATVKVDLRHQSSNALEDPSTTKQPPGRTNMGERTYSTGDTQPELDHSFGTPKPLSNSSRDVTWAPLDLDEIQQPSRLVQEYPLGREGRSFKGTTRDSHAERSSTDDSFDKLTINNETQTFLAEWKHVLNCYTDKVWGDLLPKAETAESEVNALELSQQSRGRLKSSALRRLEMLWDHITQSSSLQGSAYQFLPERSSFMNDFRHDSSMYGHQGHQKLEVNGPVMGLLTDEEEAPMPPFYCPWIGCHHRFKNSSLIQTDSYDVVFHVCAHVDCAAYFTKRKDWLQHMQEAHHDLVGIKPLS